MFQAFDSEYKVNFDLSDHDFGRDFRELSDNNSDVRSRYGGYSFTNGLYRIIKLEDEANWNKRVGLGFPDFIGRISCFGFDWLGRIFAADAQRPENGGAGVVMFEPGTGEVLEIPFDVISFHNVGLIELKDAVLAEQFFSDWIASGGAAPEYDECIGYKVPLFLGGSDELKNLEVCNIDVYWHVSGQIISGKRHVK